jgi:hypothetical protein
LIGDAAADLLGQIRLRPIALRSQGPNGRGVAHKPNLSKIFAARQQEHLTVRKV